MNNSFEDFIEMFNRRDSDNSRDSFVDPFDNPSKMFYRIETLVHNGRVTRIKRYDDGTHEIIPPFGSVIDHENKESLPEEISASCSIPHGSHVEDKKWSDDGEELESDDVDEELESDRVYEQIESSDIDEGVVGKMISADVIKDNEIESPDINEGVLEEMISADVIKDDAENEELVNNAGEMKLNETLVKKNESLTDASPIVVARRKRKFAKEKTQLADTNKWSAYYMAAPETIEFKGTYGLRRRRNPLLLRTFVKEKAQLADTNKWSEYYMAAPENIEFKGSYGLRRHPPRNPNQ